MTDSKEPQNVLITDSQHCKEVVSKLNGESVLAVHCLILERGYSGKLTLVLVGTYSGDVYLFDIQENMDLFTDGGLHSLLESNDILKVGFVLISSFFTPYCYTIIDLIAPFNNQIN